MSKRNLVLAALEDPSADGPRFDFLDAVQDSLIESGLVDGSAADTSEVLFEFFPQLARALLLFEYQVRVDALKSAKATSKPNTRSNK
jgi:hypothetical protein